MSKITPRRVGRSWGDGVIEEKARDVNSRRMWLTNGYAEDMNCIGIWSMSQSVTGTCEANGTIYVCVI